MKNKLRICLFVGMVVAVGVSCFATYKLKSPEERIKATMDSRYGEKVKVVEMVEESSSENMRTYKLKGKDGEFFCKKYYDEENNEHFQDNYLAVKYSSEIQGILEDTFPDDCKISVDYSKGIYPELAEPSKTSLEEFLNDPVTYLQVKVDSNESWDDDKVLELGESLKGKIKVFCNIYWSSGSYYFTVTPTGDVVDTNLQSSEKEE